MNMSGQVDLFFHNLWNKETDCKGRIWRAVVGTLLFIIAIIGLSRYLNCQSIDTKNFTLIYFFVILLLIGYVLINSIFNFYRRVVQMFFIAITCILLGFAIGKYGIPVFKSIAILIFGIMVAIFVLFFLRAIIMTLTLLLSLSVASFLSLIAFLITNKICNCQFKLILYIILTISFVSYKIYGLKLNNFLISHFWKSDFQCSKIHFKRQMLLFGLVTYIICTAYKFQFSNSAKAFEILNESFITYGMIFGIRWKAIFPNIVKRI